MHVKHRFLLLMVSLFFLFSCSSDFNLYKAQIRIRNKTNNNSIEYAILKKGDTLEGNLLKFSYNKLTYLETPKISYNNNVIPISDVYSFQSTNGGYCLYQNPTKYPLFLVCRGKINMYYSPSITSQNSMSVTTGSQGTSQRGGGLATLKPIEIYYTDDEINFYTYLNIVKLKDLIKDNITALAYYEKSIKTIQKVKFISYTKVYEIINIYNGIK